MARLYIVGAGRPAKDDRIAMRWLTLAAGDGHRPSQALLGHMLFAGSKDVPPQRARGLMWLRTAENGAKSRKDDWIRDLYQHDLAAASAEDRKAATAMLDASAEDRKAATAMLDASAEDRKAATAMLDASAEDRKAATAMLDASALTHRGPFNWAAVTLKTRIAAELR